MDKTDEKILNMLKGNARMSYQDIGDAIGMSRVAAKKRVQKLEKEGIIRGYNTCIYKPGEVTVFIDIVTAPDKYDDVLEYVSTRTAYIRQIFKTLKDNHIHMVATSDSVDELKYLIKMIQKKCGDDIQELHCNAVKEVIKDVYGGIRYEQRSESNSNAGNERDRRSKT
ncbi:MAG: Lrp/AsnC family transcriptional regulator [Lachnospiraceae bacterium]|nr:Lrp/AsnC family transcriptional regulator [Lachnospiraceae bacterium]